MASLKEGVVASPVGKDLMMYDYNGNLIWTSNFVNNKVDNHIIQLVSDEKYIYGLALNHTVYKVDILNGTSDIAENNIKFIINGITYIDINDEFIKKN